MRFRGLKPIIGDQNAWREVSEALQDLFQGMTKLSFADNMESFEISNITITAGETIKFVNKIKLVPSRWFITRNSTGQAIGDNGCPDWTSSTVSLKNFGGSTTIISAVFLR